MGLSPRIRLEQRHRTELRGQEAPNLLSSSSFGARGGAGLADFPDVYKDRPANQNLRRGAGHYVLVQRAAT
ncbi:hypothetical protein G6F59_018381 [Rhizopus arrhizus]|nr:hypothetical protein G6F59_018381 [Rhizopus arrhizus]